MLSWTLRALVFFLVVLSSGAFIELLKDGGAREQGLSNATPYVGPLNALPFLWGFLSAAFIIVHSLLSKRAPRPQEKALLCLVLLCLATAPFAEFPKAAIASSLLLVVAYLLITLHVHKMGSVVVFKEISTICFGIEILSLLTIIFVPSYGLSVGWEHEGKWQGVFNHKNSLGAFCVIGYLLALLNLSRRKPLTSLATAILPLILIWGSQSVTAALCAFVITTVFLVFQISRVRATAARWSVLYLVLCLVISGGAIYLAVVGEIEIPDEYSSFSSRILIWVYLISQISESPWLGYGVDQLSIINGASGDDFMASVGFLVASAHNGFIEALYSMGVIGLILIALSLLRFAKLLSPSSAYLGYALLAAIIIENTFESKLLSLNLFFIIYIYARQAVQRSRA